MKVERSSIITLAVLVVIVVAVAIYAVFFIDESEVQKRDKTPAATALLIEDAEKSFTNMNDEPVSLADEFGKVMIVSSWASWCPQCSDSLPKLSALADEYRDRGVVVFAINRAENRYTAERFLNTITISPNLRIILDPTDHYFGASTGYAMPETILYTKDGQVKVHQRGDLQPEELRQHLDELTK